MRLQLLLRDSRGDYSVGESDLRHRASWKLTPPNQSKIPVTPADQKIARRDRLVLRWCYLKCTHFSRCVIEDVSSDCRQCEYLSCDTPCLRRRETVTQRYPQHLLQLNRRPSIWIRCGVAEHVE